MHYEYNLVLNEGTTVILLVIITLHLFILKNTVYDIQDLPLATIEQAVILDLVKLIPKWKFIARRLEIPEPNIVQIRMDYPNDIHENATRCF